MKCPNCNNALKVRTTIGNTQYAFCYMCHGKVKVVKIRDTVRLIVYEHIEVVIDEDREDGSISCDDDVRIESREESNSPEKVSKETHIDELKAKFAERERLLRDKSKATTHKQLLSTTPTMLPKQPVFDQWNKI